jgi:hypothetical protein
MARRLPAPKSIPTGRWRKTRTEMLDRLGDPSRLETELVDRLILNLIEADAAMKEARTDPIQTGPRGQSVEHPGFRIAARCESTALAIANKLGVLEVARSKSEEEGKEAAPVDRVEDELAAIRKRKSSG